MINKICLNDVATYKEQSMEPNKINYIYGSNGSGKTTISRVIKEVDKYGGCNITWENKIDTLVYNKDFIDENFSNSKSIKGIFTLGKDTKDTKEKIEQLKNIINLKAKEIEKYNKTLENAKAELVKLDKDFEERCWIEKKKYEKDYKEAFQGYIGKKETFKNKCLEQYSMLEVALDLEGLKNDYATLFRQEVKILNPIQDLNILNIDEIQDSDILRTAIIGKDDIEISKLITKLQNSDWIKQGMQYLNNSDGKCPFCQQKHTDTFKHEIESYFDESYEKNYNELKNFKKTYSEFFKLRIAQLKNIVNDENELIDFHELSETLEDIEEKFDKNIKIIDSKIERPSIQIKLELMDELFLYVTEKITNYNEIIKRNNELVNNLSTKREEVKLKVWDIITNNLRCDIERYNKDYENKMKMIRGTSHAKKKGENEIDQCDKKIKEMELSITSVIPTINEINKILSSFGFYGFKLAHTEEKGEYKIVRNDGNDVNETLSEGEYRFITFLYFYQLIKGSNEASGMTKDKIVFIDDPICSLDSNVLFIVSNLVKNIIKDCIEDKDGIKQVFVSTHNLYFYKEIVFRGNREGKTKYETYWIIKKKDETSFINKYEDKPIQTTYELLWRELDDPNITNKANIFNTLRRILEYYFNILGGISYEECINSFEGEDKLLCKALVSFINDGSHFISDDLVLCLESEDIEKYLNVFKLIFKKMGHESHYNMMMRKSES